jgi:hypothetical protein
MNDSPEADAVSDEAIAEDPDEPGPDDPAPPPAPDAEPETMTDESVPPTDEIDPTESTTP